MSISRKLLTLWALPVLAALLAVLLFADVGPLQLALTFGAGVMGFGFIAALTRALFSTRVERLVNTARRMKDGNFGARVDDPEGDELGAIGSSLDTLAAEVQRLLEVADLRREYAERVIEAMPVGIVVLDANLRILSANNWCLTRCHLADDSSLVGVDFGQALGIPDLKGQFKSVLETGAARIGLAVSVRFPCSAEHTPARLSIVLIGRQGPEAERRLFAIIEDKSEQEKTAAQFRDLETRFQDVVDTAVDGILVIDGQDRLGYVNRAAEKMFGWPAAELRERPVSLILPETKSKADWPASPRVREHSGVMSMEGVRQDGSRFPVELTLGPQSHGHDASITAVVRDISERLAAETALHASEESFRILIERSPDIVAIHRAGKLVYMNPAGITTLGYQRLDEVVDKPVLEVVAPEDRDAVAGRVRQMAMTGQPVPAREEHFVRKNGTYVVAEVMAAPITFQGERAFAVLARDVTERRQLVAHMMQIDRMAAAGALAAGIGHEINNPLAYVIANLNEVLERVRSAESPPAGIDELLSEAREGAERVRRIVHSLRSFSRPDGDSIELVQIEKAAEFAADVCANDIRHRAQLIREYGVTPRVRANEAKLGQVILNVLMNSAQAIPVGQAELNQIRIRTRAEGSNVIIEITDTGGGMPPEVQKRAFEPFFTTKPIGQGTGLGLSIVHSNVSSMGGSIAIESAVGLGTTMRISLPAAENDHVPTPRPQSPVVAAPPPRRKRVLVIDDEVRLARAIVRALSVDFDAEYVTSGYTALDALRSGQAFDAIVCDLMMPDLTGMDFYAELRRLSPAQAERTLFLTGGAFTDSARAFLQEVPDRWLEKPFEPAKLLELVARMAE